MKKFDEYFEHIKNEEDMLKIAMTLNGTESFQKDQISLENSTTINLQQTS